VRVVLVLHMEHVVLVLHMDHVVLVLNMEHVVLVLHTQHCNASKLHARISSVFHPIIRHCVISEVEEVSLN
jgi:hypothetical protein